MGRLHPAQQGNADTTDALQALQEKLQRYELIFKATHDVLYDLDLKNGCVEWNDALYAQYGYDQSEPTATLEWWTSHVHPDDALLLENKITDLFESKTNSWQYDYRFRRADGKYNYVRDRGVLLRDNAGEPVRIIGSLLDMTAQKQLDIAKDEFISLVSHQLRTPLTVIRVYGEMLTGGMFGNLSQEQAQWVRNMTNSSARLIDIVGDILNVSRLDLGRVNIVPQTKDLGQLLSNWVREVQPLADEKKVEIRLNMSRKPLEMPLDEAILGQIIHNLLTNAIRYTKPGKGKIAVSVVRHKDGPIIQVHDNGIGIPKSAQAHIFERFYRAKNALGMEAQGSGLGLYLIKVMCDAFGGKVSFKSSGPLGTTFYVQLPKTGMVASYSKAEKHS